MAQAYTTSAKSLNHNNNMKRKSKTIVARAAMTLLLTMLTLLAFPTKASAWEYQGISGTGGANRNEQCDKLFDGDTSTKWCADFFDGAYVEFSTSAPIVPKYYVLTTGNDIKGGARNPKAWTISAKDENGDWVELAAEDDASLPTINQTSQAFSIDNYDNNSYQYFKFEITEIQGGEVFELSEFQFLETGLPWAGDGGYCGNSLGNVYYEIATINGEKTLTIRKNPNATTGDFNMKDYDNDNYEISSVFAPWIYAEWEDWGDDVHYSLSCFIENVVIEEGVTSIGNNAFFDCNYLTSATIPNSVTSIGEYAFNACDNVTDVYCYANPDALDWAKCGYDFNKNTQFHVYENQLVNYQTKFSNAIVQFVGDIEAPKTCVITVTANGNGQTETETSGVHELPYTKKLSDFIISNNPASVMQEIEITNIESVGDNVVVGAQNGWDASFTVTDEGTSTVTITLLFMEVQTTIDLTVTATRVFSVPANLANNAYWATFYSSEANFQAPEGTQVFAVNLDGTTISLTKIEDRIVNQGQGVVLKKTTEGDFVMTKTTESSTGDYSTNSLTGTDNGVIGQSNAYVLGYTAAAGVGFYKLATDGAIRANRAYLTYDGTLTRDYFNFEGATAIATATNEPSAQQHHYDLMGRRVEQPTKGLYILRSSQGKNGKKLMIK